VAAKENAERSASRYIEETLESLNDGFLRMDAQGRLTYVNRSAETMLMGRSEMLNRTWQELFPAAIGTDIDVAMQRVMQEKISLEIENHYAPWNKWYLVKIQPMDDGGVTTVFQDITEAKRMREALQQTEAHLEQELARRTEQVTRAERALATNERMAAVGTLASGLAHDMNNIAMPLELRMKRLLEDPSLTPEIRTGLGAVRTLLDHLRHMAKNLSLFSRDPEQEGVVGTTQLAPWWSDVEGLIASSLFAKRDGYIELRGDIPPALPPVNVSPHRLTQAILNLVHNGRDAILAAGLERVEPRDIAGHIRIEARRPENESFVMIAVSDDGTGMTLDVLRRATEPFFTTRDRSESPGGSGSGLGLALVQSICERSGGSLSITSEVGRGTTITLLLPVATETIAAGTEGGRDLLR
jgi:PAS domain S-box-containing protein